MSSWGSKDAQIHIANDLGRPIYVLITPSSSWAWADVGALVLTTAAMEIGTGGGASGAAAVQVGTMAKTIKTLKDMYAWLETLEVFRLARAGYTAVSVLGDVHKVTTAVTASMADNTNQTLLKFREFLQGNAATIAHGEYRRVNDTSFLAAWNAMNPSYWGSLSGCSTAHILIVDETLNLFASFDAGADESWVVTREGVVRAKYGKIWVRDPGAGKHKWPGGPRWPGLWPGGVTAALPHGDKVFFFNRNNDEYIRYDLGADDTDADYPKQTSKQWKLGAFASSFTAVLPGKGSKAYFFAGDQYIRYDVDGDKIDADYPMAIAGNWPGLAPRAADVAFLGAGGKAFFFDFAAGQYTRYDMARDAADSGYPKSTAAEWPGLWDRFDAAFARGNKYYFFRGNEYIRWDVQSDRIDPGYPAPIGPLFDPNDPALALVGGPTPIGNGGKIAAPATLTPGREVTSANGKIRLIYQGDGNLVLYRDGKALWSSKTSGKSAGKATFQDDGNLVVYDAQGKAVWSSGKYGAAYTGSTLVVQDDANLVAYDRNGKPYWASDTGGK